jgi:hypothetical protein
MQMYYADSGGLPEQPSPYRTDSSNTQGLPGTESTGFLNRVRWFDSGRGINREAAREAGLRAIYSSSHERTQALDGWLWHDNHRRQHSAIGHQPPIRTNRLGSYP